MYITTMLYHTWFTFNRFHGAVHISRLTVIHVIFSTIFHLYILQLLQDFCQPLLEHWQGTLCSVLWINSNKETSCKIHSDFTAARVLLFSHHQLYVIQLNYGLVSWNLKKQTLWIQGKYLNMAHIFEIYVHSIFHMYNRVACTCPRIFSEILYVFVYIWYISWNINIIQQYYIFFYFTI